MTRQDIQKNFDLSTDFNDFVIKNPKIMKGVPADAFIVFVPKRNKELANKNIKLGRKISKEQKKKVFKAIRSTDGWSVEPLVAH